MNAAVYPEDCSEDLSDGLTLADVTAVPISDIDGDSPAIRDADVLIVELGHGALRQLREMRARIGSVP